MHRGHCSVQCRGIHSGHRVDFGLGVSGLVWNWALCPCCFLRNCKSFWSRVKSCSIPKSDKYQIIGFVLKTSDCFRWWTDKGGASPILGLLFVGTTHAFVVAAMVAAGFSISGAHLNPAVTLGLAVGGHITVVRSFLYWIIQLLASSLASFSLNYVTGGMVIHLSFANFVGYTIGWLSLEWVSFESGHF